MKRIITLALAVVMLLSLSITAAAYTVTMDSTAHHTYTAYQVFSGELDESTGTKILSNVAWGSGVNGDALLAALKADAAYGAAFADCADAADVAEVLAGYANNGDDIQAIARIIAANKAAAAASGTTKVEGLDAGYYLILDTTAAASMPEGDAYSDFILEVVSDVTVDAKDETVSSEKKVKDINDTTETALSDWQDSADHDIGDHVPFQLKATIADDFDKYETYKLVFHDKESDGLTFEPATVKAYVDGAEITEGFTVVEDPTDGCTFEVVFDDLTSIDIVGNGSVVTVEYTSILNENAKIGYEGNPNEMRIEYSNNPNAGVEGVEESTGKTPWDKVIVFTYELDVNKVDENKQPLTGAGFTLYKIVDGAETQIGEELTGEQMTSFSWKGLDDGQYVLKETTTPKGFNTIDPIPFTITAAHDLDAADPKLTSLTVDPAESFEVQMTQDDQNCTGVISSDVENKKGSTLPSTGGIGTTIFYVLGGILVACAAVLLITRKRMSAKG